MTLPTRDPSNLIIATMPRSAAVGYGGLIVMRNLHRLLRLAALCFLLSCLLPALYKAIPTENGVVISWILGQVFLIYLTALSKKDMSALLNPDPDSAQCSDARDMVASVAFVMCGILSVIQLKEAYVEARQIIAICKDFGMVALAVTIGGTMYVAQSLARETCGHIGELKSTGRWGSRGLSWTVYTVRASAWMSGIAFWVLLWWPSLLLTERQYGTWRSGDLLRLVAGASVVGMPALLFLCLLSTQAYLYVSCNSYYSADNEPLLRATAASFHDEDGGRPPFINHAA